MNLANLQQQNQQLIERNKLLEQERSEQLELIQNKDVALQKQKRLNDQLMELLAQLKRQRFTSSSEKVSSDQLSLFDEAEASIDEEPVVESDDTVEVKAHSKRKGGRVKLPGDLPREEVVHDLPESEKVCPHWNY